MAKPKVLIVEDSQDIQEMFRDALAQRMEVLSAFSIEEAKELFLKKQDLSAVAMDACVPGNKPNTMDLVRMFRQTFVGPMIAISSDDSYSRQLVLNGCSHRCEKYDLPEMLLRLLG